MTISMTSDGRYSNVLQTIHLADNHDHFVNNFSFLTDVYGWSFWKNSFSYLINVLIVIIIQYFH